MPEKSSPETPDPTATPRSKPEPVEEPQSVEADDAAPVSVRDRWWWSAGVSILLGFVVVGFQWDFLLGEAAAWPNWLVAAIGAAVAISGLVRLARDYKEHKAS